VAVADSTQQQLAWEARQRPRAGAAAIVAGVLTIGANIWSAVAFRNGPTSGFLESLQNVQRPGPVGTTQSLRTRSYEFIHDHAAAAIGTSLALAIGMVALGWAVSFLAAATRARRPEMPRFSAYLPLIGAVLLAVGSLLRSIASVTSASDFLNGPHTVDAAQTAATNSVLVASAFLGFIGQFTLAAGLVLVSLHAMRAGLLTRLMGIFGIIVGVLQILPIGVLPVVEAFWLLALGVLFLGYWTSPGVPPAWRTGRAEPWPSQAEIAQQRRDAAEARRGGGRRAEPAAEAPEDPKRPAPVGARAKRKRKRRR
jgi:hypothetical protein